MLRSVLVLIALSLVATNALAAEAPSVGTLVAGGDGLVADEVTLLAADQTVLADAIHRFRGERAEVPQVDFQREVVLVVNAGASYETNPPTCAGTLDSERAFTVLIHVPTYQISGTTPPPSHDIYIFLRLPRRTDKPYAIRFDRRHLIAEPPVWVETTRLALGADGKVSAIRDER